MPGAVRAPGEPAPQVPYGIIGGVKRVWGIALLTIGVWARADIGAEIDRLFRDYDRPGVPGAAVVAIADGEVVHRRGYGLAERETSRAVSERTNFRTASVSKQFTAMAILALIDRGRLDE